ncbi:MAG: hypothetical protein ACK57P_14625 [Planctomycetota bacterium]
MNQALPYASITWTGDSLGGMQILDQTELPLKVVMRSLATVEDVHEAIVALRVRGAPAIGIAAAYGVIVALQDSIRNRLGTVDAVRVALGACDYLATSRPTAVNLFWALARMRRVVQGNPAVASAVELGNLLLREARLIHDEDPSMSHAIGE